MTQTNQNTPSAISGLEGNALIAQQLTQFLDPGKLSDIQEWSQAAQKLMTYYRCAILEVETKFRVLNEQFSLEHERNPIDSIKSRLKSPESINEKIHRKDLSFDLKVIEENLNDIAGVRVITSFVDDIYMLANCLIEQDDVRLIKMKDYIENPKPNGYRSLHLIVEVPIFLQKEKRYMKVEVQLRTIAMEVWANLEHKLRYKKELPDDVMAETSIAMGECARMSAKLDLQMQEIRNVIERANAMNNTEDDEEVFDEFEQ